MQKLLIVELDKLQKLIKEDTKIKITIDNKYELRTAFLVNKNVSYNKFDVIETTLKNLL